MKRLSLALMCVASGMALGCDISIKIDDDKQDNQPTIVECLTVGGTIDNGKCKAKPSPKESSQEFGCRNDLAYTYRLGLLEIERCSNHSTCVDTVTGITLERDLDPELDYKGKCSCENKCEDGILIQNCKINGVGLDTPIARKCINGCSSELDSNGAQCNNTCENLSSSCTDEYFIKTCSEGYYVNTKCRRGCENNVCKECENKTKKQGFCKFSDEEKYQIFSCEKGFEEVIGNCFDGQICIENEKGAECGDPISQKCETVVECIDGYTVRICADGKYDDHECIQECKNGECADCEGKTENEKFCISDEVNNGVYHCNNGILIKDKSCSESEICMNSSCVSKYCVDGEKLKEESERFCIFDDNSKNHVYYCKDGKFWTQEECNDGTTCIETESSVVCGNPDCYAPSTCNDASVRICRNNVIEDIQCQNGCENGKCKECTSQNIDVCINNNVYHCDDDFVSELQKECGDELFCNVNGNVASCGECKNGEPPRCNEGKAEKCENGAWVEDEENQKNCQDGVLKCNDGESKCNGNEVHICIGGDWSSKEPCAYGCQETENAAECKTKCEEGTIKCSKAGDNQDKNSILDKCVGGMWTRIDNNDYTYTGWLNHINGDPNAMFALNTAILKGALENTPCTNDMVITFSLLPIESSNGNSLKANSLKIWCEKTDISDAKSSWICYLNNKSMELETFVCDENGCPKKALKQFIDHLIQNRDNQQECITFFNSLMQKYVIDFNEQSPSYTCALSGPAAFDYLYSTTPVLSLSCTEDGLTSTVIAQ